MKRCDEDDVLIARYGASIGRVLRGKAGAYNVALVKTVPDTNQLNKGFLFSLLSDLAFQRFVVGISSRAAQAGFNKDDLSRFRFRLPPLEEQLRFESCAEGVRHLERWHSESLVQLDALFASIQHRAFRGDL